MEQSAARPLFRLQAVQFRADRGWYGATLRPSVSLQICAAALTLVVVGTAAFLASQSYARKTTVTGYLAPPHGVVRVMAPRPGIIVSVDVADGAMVHAGDPLLRVTSARMSESGADLDEDVRRSLLQRRDLQMSQIAIEEVNSAAEGQRLGKRVAQLQDECEALRAQLAAQRDRAALAQQQASVSREAASKGYVSGVEQRRREDVRLSQAQGLDALRQQLAAKEDERDEQRYALAQLPVRTAERLAGLRSALADIDNRLAETEAGHAYLVVAPAAGRVSALQADVGSPADPSKPLLSIVPEGQKLQAVLFVPEQAIGFVSLGQEVRLSLDSFPIARFGAQKGTISSVARTLLRPEQMSAAPVPPHEPSYLITVALQEQTMTAYGRTIPLQADMQLHAEIVFDRRSFVQWLLDPVLSASGRR